MRRNSPFIGYQTAARLFTSLADVSTYYAAKGASYKRVHELVDALKNRIAALALVNGTLEYLSPQSRTDGGFGVVASVDGPNQVTLAPGATLTSGRVRLWDVTGTAYLDAGGVEARVSGLVVTMADTTGMAAGDVIHAERLEVTSYAAAVALEAALGTGHNGEIRVVKRTSGVVILRRVVRSGVWTSTEVNFAAVTATPCGEVASVAGAVVTVTAPHTLATAAQILRVQVVTDGTWSDVASGQWSVSGDDVTVPQATADAIAAALGAGKTCRLHAEGVSELCIGASPCALQPAAGVWRAFVAAGLDGAGGRCIHAWGGVYRGARMVAHLASYSALDAREDRITVGWAADSACVYGGIARNDTGVRVWAGSGAAVSTETNIGETGGDSGVAGTQEWCGISHTSTRDIGTDSWVGAVSSLAAAYVNNNVNASKAAIASAKLYENHNLRAVISRMECA